MSTAGTPNLLSTASYLDKLPSLENRLHGVRVVAGANQKGLNKVDLFRWIVAIESRAVLVGDGHELHVEPVVVFGVLGGIQKALGHKPLCLVAEMRLKGGPQRAVGKGLLGHEKLGHRLLPPARLGIMRHLGDVFKALHHKGPSTRTNARWTTDGQKS